MKFHVLCEYWQRLEKTDSRLEMTAVLAELLKKAAPEESAKVAYLSLGRLAPLFEDLDFNLAAKMMIRVLSRAYGQKESLVTDIYNSRGDFSFVVDEIFKDPKESNLEVIAVYQSLRDIAESFGSGSQEEKINLFAKLLQKLDKLSARYVVRIPIGRLRLGFSDMTVLDALSWMATGDKSLRGEIEAAYNVRPDVGEIVRAFKSGGLAALKKVDGEIGYPILSARCQRLTTPEEIMEKMGGRAAAEPKFDGSRAQVHLGVPISRKKESDQTTLGLGLVEEGQLPVKIYSRNLEDTTAMFPELAQAAVKHIKAKSAILDGEALGFDPKSGAFLPFQETIQRKRKYLVKEKMAEVPLKLFVFDLLHLNGKSLLREPFSQRRALLESIVLENDTIKLAPQTIVTNAKQLKDLFEKALSQGLEGLVIKDLAGEYQAGARGFNWVKLKGELDTVDAVVLGYYFGRGKRNKFGIGAFLVGVLGEDDTYQTLAKVGTGLTDEQWVEMRQRCDAHKVTQKPKNVVVSEDLAPDVWVTPEIVVIIKADSITKSPSHTAGKTDNRDGFALRFPRLIDFRIDKTPEDVTTVAEIDQMYQTQ